jgi:hypothetical protein
MGWTDLAHSRREYDESSASMERYDPSTFHRGDADGYIEYPAARIASAA